MIDIEIIRNIMDELNTASKIHTTCKKTYVGAAIGITSENRFVLHSFGFNTNLSYNCKKHGCYRIEKFGTDSKEYRKFCKAIHAEENALKDLPEQYSSMCDTAIVTRYPCDNCAKLLVEHGIKNVYYGRPFPVSEETEKLFKDNNVTVVHVKDWIGDDNDTNR